MTAQVDITANRATRNYRWKEQVARLLWWSVGPAFRFSPRPCYRWRAMLLRLFGAEIGQGVHVAQTARITMPWNLSLGDQVAVGDCAILYALGQITIAERATISQYAHLCAGTHDTRLASRPLLKQPITICKDAWVCAEAFVGPNVQIGAGAILGARAVAMRDVPAGLLGIGNPLQFRTKR